jgi:predicted Rossmann-fold nucleotide-binding protein
MSTTLDEANFNEQFAAFKRTHGIHHVIAFSGGAESTLPGLPENDALQEQYATFQQSRDERLVADALDILQHYRVAVLTGGTRFGFPLAAVTAAQARNLKTIGVFPRYARDKGHVVEGLDLAFCVEPLLGASQFGDESSVFAKLLDAVIVCAGGAGTLIEISHILKMNEMLLKQQQPVKLIVPVHGTGRVADGLPFLWGKQEIKNACMPAKPIYTGFEAAKFVESRIDLFNV